jgi:hypothetical protein
VAAAAAAAARLALFRGQPLARLVLWSIDPHLHPFVVTLSPSVDLACSTDLEPPPLLERTAESDSDLSGAPPR